MRLNLNESPPGAQMDSFRSEVLPVIVLSTVCAAVIIGLIALVNL